MWGFFGDMMNMKEDQLDGSVDEVLASDEKVRQIEFLPKSAVEN